MRARERETARESDSDVLILYELRTLRAWLVTHSRKSMVVWIAMQVVMICQKKSSIGASSANYVVIKTTAKFDKTFARPFRDLPFFETGLRLFFYRCLNVYLYASLCICVYACICDALQMT